MDNFLIGTMADTTVLDTLTTAANAMITTFSPYFVSLSNEDSSGIRTMSAGREGYARLIAKIAEQHIDSLARSNTPGDLSERLEYDDSLETVRQSLIRITEMIADTQTANASDIMKYTDRFAANLQTARKGNAALDEALQPVDEYNSRFGNSGNTTSRSTDTAAS